MTLSCPFSCFFFLWNPWITRTLPWSTVATRDWTVSHHCHQYKSLNPCFFFFSCPSPYSFKWYRDPSNGRRRRKELTMSGLITQWIGRDHTPIHWCSIPDPFSVLFFFHLAGKYKISDPAKKKKESENARNWLANGQCATRPISGPGLSFNHFLFGLTFHTNYK